MPDVRLTAAALEDEIGALIAEADQIDRDLQDGELTTQRFHELTAALIEPRLTAARALRHAATLFRRIPALGVRRKPKGKR